MIKGNGGSRLTQAEIGRRLGVSQTLVGYALNGSGRISPELRDRIVAEAQRLGYTPNKAARALKSGRSHLVALCLPQVISPFFGLILAELQRLAERDGYDLVTTSGKAPHLSQWPLDGVLLYDDTPLRAEQLMSGYHHSAPIVVFGNNLQIALDSPRYSRLDYVGIELYDAARQSVRTLIAAGCQKLAFIASKCISHSQDERWCAFHDVVAESGVSGIEIQVPDSSTLRQETKRVLGEYLSEGARFDGIFCGNDDVALGSLRALRGVGCKVPDDVLVIGCDGLPDTADAEPALSTIALPIEELCEHAWNTLLWRLGNPAEPARREALRPRIIWRDSAPDQGVQP